MAEPTIPTGVFAPIAPLREADADRVRQTPRQARIDRFA